MKRYYKFEWNESRGDEFDSWGTSIWFVEIDDEGYPIKQVEKYKNGKVLKYDNNNIEDKYGGLGDQAIDLNEFEGFAITEQEFKNEWK